MEKFEACVIGAGVIGIAVAHALSLSKDINPEKILLLESRADFGQGISSRNSEVIHGGLYYRPGSLKAELCIRGKALLYEYLSANGISHARCGKLVVAQRHQQDALLALRDNAVKSGLHDLQILNKHRLSLKESSLSAYLAVLSPSTGIVDSHHYMHSLLDKAQRRGIIFAANSPVSAIKPCRDGFEVSIETNQADSRDYTFTSKLLINSAGLSADKIADKIIGLKKDLIPKILMCKGDYFSYAGANPFSHLIYPIPEADTVGLGIHCTMDLNNQLRIGPDAAYIAEESYHVEPYKTERFAEAVQRYFPGLKPDLLQPSYSGIRPKLSGPGEPAGDFVFQTEDEHRLKGLVQLFGMESPGLTASPAIAQHIIHLFGLSP
ncbi:MAG TPA: FAD-dependent oxidoreductase [Gammaproteobacteria bacterium]|nr:FAD-dependent oxidoreductase [Gammaproteobacteria bacterium]